MKSHRFLAVCLVALLGTMSAGAQADQTAPSIPTPSQSAPPQRVNTMWVNDVSIDIPYSGKSPSQTLDLYLPNEGDGPFPLIIEIHGGGFMMGEKSTQISPMLTGLQRGYAVASINYRLSTEAPFPAAVNDVKAAIKFLRANACGYGLDPDRFVTWGASAGGNLSVMAATSADHPELLDDSSDGFINDISDRVQAAVDWFGPLDFSKMDAQFQQLGLKGVFGPTNAPQSAESRYIGHVIGTPAAQALTQQANPMTYLSSQTPPIYIQHGTADRNVPITQSEELARRLQPLIGRDRVVFEAIPNAGHGTPEFEAPDNISKIFDFLDHHLKKPR